MIKSDEIYVTKMEICMEVKNQQLELGMEQQTGSKSGKKYVKDNLYAEYMKCQAG